MNSRQNTNEAPQTTEVTLGDTPLLIALEHLANHLGLEFNLSDESLRENLEFNSVESIALACRIRVRRVRLHDRWWQRHCDPLLCFFADDESPISLLPSNSGIRYFDPRDRSTRTLDKQTAQRISPNGWTVYRTLPQKKLAAYDLLKFAVRGNAREFLTITAMGILAGLIAAAIPVGTGIVFDYLIPAGDRRQLIQMGIFLLLFALAGAMFSLVRSFSILRLQGKITASLQAAIWDRLLSLPASFFRQFSAGDLAQRSLGVTSIQQIFTNSSLNAVLSGIFSIFSFLLLFFYSWRLALAGVGLAVIAAGVALACGIYRLNTLREVVAGQDKLSSLLLQLISAVSKFRIAAAEQRALKLWTHDFCRLKKASAQARTISNLLAVFQSAFPVLSLGVIFYLYSLLASQPDRGMSTGHFLAFLSAFAQGLSALVMLSSTVVAGLSAVPIFELAQPIFSELPEITGAKIVPPQLSGAIEICDVSFRYAPGLPGVLNHISLQAAPGEFIAIVGPSGSGKSTLLRLLLGFENPEAGSIYYDGNDLSMLDVQALRRQLGVVLQTSRPIRGTIFENIAGFLPLSMETAWESARMTGLEREIEQMPMGMHTHLSDAGGNISGGQRQRLMIARALVANPRMLMLDEATSALDNETQATVNRTLKNLNITRIVVAHRLSTIKDADRIYVLKDGSIVQSGTLAELMEQEGTFKELAQRQLV